MSEREAERENVLLCERVEMCVVEGDAHNTEGWIQQKQPA